MHKRRTAGIDIQMLGFTIIKVFRANTSNFSLIFIESLIEQETPHFNNSKEVNNVELCYQAFSLYANSHTSALVLVEY